MSSPYDARLGADRSCSAPELIVWRSLVVTINGSELTRRCRCRDPIRRGMPHRASGLEAFLDASELLSRLAQRIGPADAESARQCRTGGSSGRRIALKGLEFQACRTCGLLGRCQICPNPPSDSDALASLRASGRVDGYRCQSSRGNPRTPSAPPVRWKRASARLSAPTCRRDWIASPGAAFIC